MRGIPFICYRIIGSAVDACPMQISLVYRMEINELDYNTQMPQMQLPEYGRNIQRMVDYALTIEDREARTRCAHTIIRIMGNLFPHLRDVNDFKHKLWDHLAIMSDFKLDIDYPYEPVRPEHLASRPKKVPYQRSGCKVRHYGHLVEELIAKASTMEEGSEKERLIQMIANHMKKSYYSMNQEITEDKKVLDDLAILSDGHLSKTPEELPLMDVREIIPNKKSHKNNRRK